jgi:hypothetical protein
MADKYRPVIEKLGTGTRHQEDRSEEEFRAEVDDWLENVRGAFEEVVRDLIAITKPPVKFTVHNHRGRFLEDVEVEVHIDGPVIQHPKPLSERSISDRLPSRPRDWGPWNSNPIDYGSLTQINPSIYNRPAKPNATNFRNSGSVTATLSLQELRPWRSHTFTEADDHDDLVLLTQDLDLTAVRVTATATARSIDSNCVTEFTQPVAAPVDVTEMVRKFLNLLCGRYFSAEACEST